MWNDYAVDVYSSSWLFVVCGLSLWFVGVLFHVEFDYYRNGKFSFPEIWESDSTVGDLHGGALDSLV